MREPVLPAGAVRIGGFGGTEGLRKWLADNAIDAVVDATHPFAGTISSHAADAARAGGVPIVHLRRPGWSEQPGDRWSRVPDLAAAAHAVTAFDRVFLTIGRQGVGAFAALGEPWFLIRAIDPPTGPVPPQHLLLLARGPFTAAQEVDLLREHRISVMVTKDSGGDLTAAKLTAARRCGIPVVVVDRPPVPEGVECAESVAAAWEWLNAR